MMIWKIKIIPHDTEPYYVMDGNYVRVFPTQKKAAEFLENRYFTRVEDWWYTNAVVRLDALLEDSWEER